MDLPPAPEDLPQAPRAVCTHGPRRWAGSVRTTKFLPRAQVPQLTLGLGKEKEFGYLKKNNKKE